MMRETGALAHEPLARPHTFILVSQVRSWNVARMIPLVLPHRVGRNHPAARGTHPKGGLKEAADIVMSPV